MSLVGLGRRGVGLGRGKGEWAWAVGEEGGLGARRGVGLGSSRGWVFLFINFKWASSLTGLVLGGS